MLEEQIIHEECLIKNKINSNFYILFLKLWDLYGLILDGHKYGIFWYGNEPAIFLRDLDLIKKVQVTDFEYFYDFGEDTIYTLI